MSLAAIIVTYHTGAPLQACLNAVLAEKNIDAVYCVNNGNPPEVETRLRACQHEKFHLIEGQGNIGFGRACNLAANLSQEDALLLLNPDCLPQDDAVDVMLRSLLQQPENTLLGGKILDPQGNEQRGSRRRTLTPRRALVEMLPFLARSPQDFLYLHEEPDKSNFYAVPAVSGACMMLRRTFYQRLGGFDPHYFLHVEDLDLCYRVQECGSVLHVANAHFLHVGASSKVSSFKLEWWKTQSFIYYFKKHFFKNISPWSILFIYLGIYARFFGRCLQNTLSSLQRKIHEN